MRFWITTISFLWGIVFISCKEGSHSLISPVSTSLEGIKNENFGRSTWQKPNMVIDKLGDLSDKTVADIGAGTGYFTFRMAFKASKVIAVDIDPDMIALLESFRMNLPSEIQGKIETRLVSANDPMLKEDECDVVVIINTIAYISPLQPYLTQIKISFEEWWKNDGCRFQRQRLAFCRSFQRKIKIYHCWRKS